LENPDGIIPAERTHSTLLENRVLRERGSPMRERHLVRFLVIAVILLVGVVWSFSSVKTVSEKSSAPTPAREVSKAKTETDIATKEAVKPDVAKPVRVAKVKTAAPSAPAEAKKTPDVQPTLTEAAPTAPAPPSTPPADGYISCGD
jgi:hypothetical protein